MKTILFGCTVLFGAMVLSASAAHTIVVGTHELMPDMPGQLVEISVSGGELIDGVNFNIQIENGDSSTLSPRITNLDILTGTVFDGKNTGSWDNHVLDQIAWDWTEASAGETVLADGLLGTLTVDTTGFHDGAWSLQMSDTLNGPTDFAGLSGNITDGWITIQGTTVPEPSTFLFAMFGLCFLLYFFGRRKKAF